jgi:hypothetical protein
MVSEQEWKQAIVEILTANPSAARRDIIDAMTKKFPGKNEATLGERLSFFAEAVDDATGKHYVLRTTPRPSRTGAPPPAGSAKMDEPANRAPAPITDAAAQVEARKYGPDGVPEDSTMYDGPSKRLTGSRWFKVEESTDATKSGQAELWEVRFPDESRWQFGVPTREAGQNYDSRKLPGKVPDVKVLQELFSRPGASVLMIGHSGVGKTSAVYAALADPKWEGSDSARTPPWDKPRVYRGVMSNMSKEQLIGQFTPNPRMSETDKRAFIWQDGILTNMVRYGGVFIADEINFTAPDVLVAMNSLLDDDKFITLPENNGEIIRAHNKFHLVAAMNPTGFGYQGTAKLNDALKSRFTFTIWYTWSPEIEKKRFPPNSEPVPGIKNADIHTLWQKLRGGFVDQAAGGFSYPVGYRDLKTFVTNMGTFGVDAAVASLIMLFDDPLQKKTVLQIAKDVLGPANVHLSDEDFE